VEAKLNRPGSKRLSAGWRNLRIGFSDWRAAAAAFEDFCDRRLALVLVVASIIYFAVMYVQSSLKTLWYDEFFTHFLALLPVARIWEATQSGAEVHPPLPAVSAHFAQTLFGPTAFATRLPEMIAFWGMSLALFFLVRRYLGTCWAFTAVLFVFQSDAEGYATEGRPYAIVMCCAAVALLCWQNLWSGRRWLCLIGIFLSLAAVVSANAMGVLIAVPLGVGELYRTWRTRRIDFLFWIAAIAGASVLLVYLPMIHMAQRYLAHNSGGMGHMASLFHLMELPLLPSLTPIVTVLIVVWMVNGVPANRGLTEGTYPPVSDLVAATALFLLPVCQKILEHWTHSVNLRYTLSYVIGAALLFTYACAWFSRRVPGAGFAAMAVLAASVVCGGVLHYRAVHKLPRWPPEMNAAELPNLPILVDQGFHLFPVYWYNPALRNRLYFVVSREDALRASGGDTVELNLSFARDWFPVQLADRKQFFYPGSKFLFYESAAEGVLFPDWQLDACREMHASINLVKQLSPADTLYEVDIPVQ
jgi:hypothetical protein